MPDAAALLLHGHVLTPQGFVRGQVTVRSGRIERIEGRPVDEDQVRASDLPLLLPGFIDLHVHGGGGHDTMAGGDAIAHMLAPKANSITTPSRQPAIVGP